MCSTSDPRGTADRHLWAPFPEAGEGEEICERCGARPGTLEASGPCDALDPTAAADTLPEAWEFWPGGRYESVPGFEPPAKPPE